MAVAVSTSGSGSAKKADGTLSLLTTSVVGALVVLGAAALVLNIIPMLFGSGSPRPMGIVALQVFAQIAAIIGLGYAVAKFGTPTLKSSGVRGGVFFVLVSAMILAFCAWGVYRVAANGLSFGGILAIILLGVVIALVVQFFRTGRFHSWAVGMDQGNWFDTATFKRTQGLKVRRLTMLGILLVTGSGIWTLYTHSYLPHNETVKVDGVERENRMGDWVIGGTIEGTPARVVGGFTVLPDLAFTIPLILAAISLWFAWRAVNFPPFADFLIATEAEINKVSWSSRRSLIRDTIVVLVSLVLITLFLFVVDIFWSFVLSREIVKVLPSKSERERDQKQQIQKEIDW